MRRDATENRRRLLEATRDVLRIYGDDAPLELITERAGVTRGTLYRNFADRTDLYLAVLDNDIAAIRDELNLNQECGLFDVMRKLIDLSDIYHAFAAASQNTTRPSEACSPADLLATIIAGPLAAAKASKIVRDSLTTEDVLLACRMVAYGWRLDGEPEREKAIDRRLLLVIRGLSASPEIRDKME